MQTVAVFVVVITAMILLVSIYKALHKDFKTQGKYGTLVLSVSLFGTIIIWSAVVANYLQFVYFFKSFFASGNIEWLRNIPNSICGESIFALLHTGGGQMLLLIFAVALHVGLIIKKTKNYRHSDFRVVAKCNNFSYIKPNNNYKYFNSLRTVKLNF